VESTPGRAAGSGRLSGQWLKGPIYENRCDLSPDGRYFIYFAYDGRPHREHGPSWTAVSRAPWLKAIALYSKGSTWGGGGYFTGARTYWLDDEHVCVQDTREVRRDERNVWPRIGHDRWVETGWRFHKSMDAHGEEEGFREKELPRGWKLRLKFASGYELEHGPTQSVWPFPDWTWAALDGKRLVLAQKGCLFTAVLDLETGVVASKLLHDFNGMKFEERKAPY